SRQSDINPPHSQDTPLPAFEDELCEPKRRADLAISRRGCHIDSVPVGQRRSGAGSMATEPVRGLSAGVVSNDLKYKTADALAEDVRARALDIRIRSDLSSRANPVRGGGRLVGTRLAIQPMEGCDGTLDGAPDELTLRRYIRFGAGGAKLVWGEAAAVVAEGRANPRQLLAHERHAAALARLLDGRRRAAPHAWGND